MATKRTDPSPTVPAKERGSELSDWFQINSRLLGIGAALVVVAAAGLWFYNRSRQIRTMNAERSLARAQQSLGSGNASLALSDLQQVATRYEGTSAGTEAAMLLAQQYYEQGKYQEGVDRLRKAVAKSGGNQASVEGLIGDGYAQMGKAEDAAKAYERAAGSVSYDNEKAYLLAKAARSFTAAGKLDEARRLWGQLAKNEKAPSMATEAKVRLSELNAKRAGS